MTRATCRWRPDGEGSDGTESHDALPRQDGSIGRNSVGDHLGGENACPAEAPGSGGARKPTDLEGKALLRVARSGRPPTPLRSSGAADGSVSGLVRGGSCQVLALAVGGGERGGAGRSVGGPKPPPPAASIRRTEPGGRSSTALSAMGRPSTAKAAGAPVGEVREHGEADRGLAPVPHHEYLAATPPPGAGGDAPGPDILPLHDERGQRLQDLDRRISATPDMRRTCCGESTSGYGGEKWSRSWGRPARASRRSSA